MLLWGCDHFTLFLRYAHFSPPSVCLDAPNADRSVDLSREIASIR